MPDINLVDSSLKNYYEHTEISIQVSLDGFSFCVSSEDHTLRAFRRYSFSDIVMQDDLIQAVDKVLQKDELLRLPHRNARVIIHSRKSTLVPREFHRDEHLKKLLEFNHPLDDLDEVHYSDIGGCDSVMVYAIPTYLAGMFSERYSNISFYNQAVPFLDAIFGRRKPETAVFVQLNKDFFDIAVLVDGKLKLYNSFLYVGETDLIYFILYVCKQLQLDAKYVRCYYTGEFITHADLEDAITSYMPHAQRMPETEVITQRSVIHLHDPGRFYSLLSLAACE